MPCREGIISLLRKTYTFLYVPEDLAETRELKFSRRLLLSVGAVLAVCLVATVFYSVGLFEGTSWLPGGSRIQRHAAEVSARADLMESKVARLREDLDHSFAMHEQVATAMGLEPLDADVREAGIGGRRPAVSVADLGDGEFSDLIVLQASLDKMLRQANIQHQGYQALLDTLSGRESVLDHLPSIRPVDVGWLSSRYGKRKDPFTGKLAFHRGLDYSIPFGTPVRATAAGVVVSVRNDRGLGRVIKVDHGNRITTRYAHLSRWLVKKGDRVVRGQVIAESGSSGRSTAPHLHYEVAVDGRHVNPLPYVLDSYAIR